VGTNHEAEELAELVATHPEFGYEPVGVIGDRDEFESWSTSLPFLGPVERTTDLASLASANGALIAASSLEPTQLKRVTRDLLQTDLHVHLSSGLWGIDHRRLRSVPLAHEPIFYLERISISRLNLALKRVLDVVCAGVALIFATPVIAISAIAVKLYDRGPVLFRQVRVGKDGEHFHVYKLRTMVPNAEELVADLRETANFRDGPLFKMERDPRLTKVGRILEAASIDELPQLFNVLQGTMSLVGPRPALPSEAEQFDEELLERFSVPPGITGLWQVEARDNPSFRAYRRLDLFYVENWSITLDLAILVETAWSVVSRIFRGLK
jgi:exopolysaccharide biosynthesis polyprenyl glycosylphosphotransferase